MSNIGIVTTWFERGAAIVSRAYMDALSRQHQVYIYVRGGEERAIGDPRWDLPNVTWGEPPAYSWLGQIDWDHFRSWVRRYRLDMIIFNEERQWDVVLKARRLGPLLGAYVDYYTAETVPFFWLYDFLLCNTQRHHSVFREHPQALYIPWGTDCDLFRPREKARCERQVVFFHSAGMAGVNLRKGTDILVRAFQRVTGGARLVIHSQVPLERYAPVADIIRADPRIEFIHATVGAPGLYHLGDVYVYPSRLEGIGLSVPEALACGLPVITTDCPPMSEFVRHAETGWLVAVERYEQRSDGYYWPESVCSEDALAEAMQAYVDNPGLIASQGEAARQFALRYLDWRKNSAGLAERLSSFVRVTPSRALRHHVSVSVRPHHRNRAMGLVFEAHSRRDRVTVCRYLPIAVLADVRWLRNRGVRSIVAHALLGYHVCRALKRILSLSCRPCP